MGGGAIVVQLDDGDAGVVGDAEEEVGEGCAGEVTSETVVAVVVAAGEAEVGFGANLAQVETELESVLALDPGEVIGELSVPACAAAGAAFGEALEIVDGEIGKPVEEDVPLDVFEVETVGEGKTIERESRARGGVRDAAAKFVE